MLRILTGQDFSGVSVGLKAANMRGAFEESSVSNADADSQSSASQSKAQPIRDRLKIVTGNQDENAGGEEEGAEDVGKYLKLGAKRHGKVVDASST